MDLGRLIKIFTAPKDYWNEVVGEPGDIKTLLIPQMLLLAAIPAVALFVGQLLTYMRFGLSGRLFAATFAGLILQYGLNIGL